MKAELWVGSCNNKASSVLVRSDGIVTSPTKRLPRAAEEKTETHSIVPHPGHHGEKPHNQVSHIFLHEGIKETEQGNQVKRSKLLHRARVVVFS